MSESHPDLRNLRIHLRSIHDSITHFQPPAKKPPILDSSLEVAEDTHWLQYDNIPGLKKLKESIKIDLDVLDKVRIFKSMLFYISEELFSSFLTIQNLRIYNHYRRMRHI